MKYLFPLTAAALLAAPAALLAQDKDWRFGDGEMPERWSLENSAYAMCDAGLNQSPIDLGKANAVGEISVTTNYGDTSGTLAVADQKLQVDFPEGLHMLSGEKHFKLIQVHFHTPAEHAIDGERHPLVAHFVHASEEGELGVLGVMFEEGEANPALGAIAQAMENGDGTALSLDASDMIPDDLSVYRYMGSLTTPPCSEGVNWHVAAETLTASPQQIAAMAGSLGPTARSLQPVGNRLIVAPGD